MHGLSQPETFPKSKAKRGFVGVGQSESSFQQVDVSLTAPTAQAVPPGSLDDMRHHLPPKCSLLHYQKSSQKTEMCKRAIQ